MMVYKAVTSLAARRFLKDPKKYLSPAKSPHSCFSLSQQLLLKKCNSACNIFCILQPHSTFPTAYTALTATSSNGKPAVQFIMSFPTNLKISQIFHMLLISMNNSLLIPERKLVHRSSSF